MPKSVTQKRFEEIHNVPAAKPLDEAVWQAWLLRGRVRDEQRRTARTMTVMWISLAALLVAASAGWWVDATRYDVLVRFLVTAGALALMSQSLHAGHYAFAAVFGALAVLYNPVAPVFSLSGEWQRALIVASAVPFVASLTWHDAKLVPNE